MWLTFIEGRRDEEAEEEEDDEAAAGEKMYVKYDPRLHGPRVAGRNPPLAVHFLKKFLTIVKRRCRCRALPHFACSLHIQVCI